MERVVIVLDEWLSVSELSSNLKIPETTVRRHLNKFDKYFRYEKRGKGKKYHPEAMAILNKIATLYSEGYESDYIDEVLSRNFAFFVEDTNDDNTQIELVSNLEIKKQFEEFKKQQEEFNKELIKELNNQQEFIKNHLEERDKKLMIALNELQNSKNKKLEGQKKKVNLFKFWDRN